MSHCCCSESTFPSSVLANPHWGLRHNWSKGDELRSFVDAPLEFILGFQVSGFRGHQAQDNGLSRRHEPQGFKTARALSVELHEVSVHVDLVEEDLRNRLIPALRNPAGAKIAAAQVHGDHHVIGTPLNGRVDQIGVDAREFFRVIAPVLQNLPLFRVAQVGEIHLVQLQIATSQIRKSMDGTVVCAAEVGVEITHFGIDGLADSRPPSAEMQDAGGRDRHFRSNGWTDMVPQKPEVVQHRMPVETELPHNPHALRLRCNTFESDSLCGGIALAPFQAFQEVKMPHRAAEFPVCGGTQPNSSLFGDQGLDRGVLGLPQLFPRDFLPLPLFAGGTQFRTAQQAADMVGAERSFGSLHRVASVGYCPVEGDLNFKVYCNPLT